MRARLSPEGALGLHLTVGALLLFVFAWAFGEIAEDVVTREPLVRFDLLVSSWFEHNRTPGVTRLMEVVTTIGAWPVAAAVAAALGIYFIWRRHRYWLMGLLLSVPVGGVLNVALKHAFHRARPHWEHPLVTLTTFSFPSGHAMSAAVLYGFIAVWAAAHLRSLAARSAIALAALAWVSLIAFSRVYLGAHYPSDVLGGMTAGGAWLAIALTGLDVRRRRRATQARTASDRRGSAGAAPFARGADSRRPSPGAGRGGSRE